MTETLNIPVEPHIPDERELSQPITDKSDEAYQVLANESGRRVWTVMQNLIEVRGRTHADGVLGPDEVTAILMGAVTGIAFHVGRMQIGVVVAEGSEQPEHPPEVLLLNDLGNQFLHVIEQMRMTDPIAMQQVEVPRDAPLN